jgi:SAM-dependent methyltransferase
MTVDEQKLEAFMDRFIADMAATAHGATVVLGQRLGLYRAMAEAGGPQSPRELAERTGCHPRLVQEWLHAQVASGYCGYDAATGTFWLGPEQAAVLAEESGAAYLVPYMTLASSLHKDEERGARAFTGEERLTWGDHHPDLYGAVSQLTPSDYADLVTTWVPALEGVEEKLLAGARVADVGCGEGLPTLMLARAYPASTFAGYDSHAESIAIARKAAAEAGLSHQVTFETVPADATPGGQYDLVCMFDALHDMGDPVGVARRVRDILAPGGTWLIVDRKAGDGLEDNMGPIGRFSYSTSSFVCVPNALAEGGTDALGAQAGAARFRQVALDAGFTRFRQPVEAPFNLVLEVRP